MLSRKDVLGIDDKSIVDLAMSIWISCIVFNQEILQSLYKPADEESLIDTSASGISITKVLIEDGLLSNNFGVRVLFKDSIKFLSVNLKSTSLTLQPVDFFLEKMLSKIDIVQGKHRESK